MHINAKSCMKKVLPPRPCDMLLEHDVNTYKPIISNKNRKAIRRRENIAKIKGVAEVAAKKKKTEPKKVAKKVTQTKAKTPIERKPKKKKVRPPLRFPPMNSMYTPLFQYLGYQRKEFVILKTITTYSIYNQVLDFLHFKPGLKMKRSTSVIRRERIQGQKKYGGIPAPINLSMAKRMKNAKRSQEYNGVIDMHVIVQEIMTGRYPSIQPFTDRRVDTKCNICKQIPTEELPIYPCAFCWRSCHINCVYEKRPFLEFDPKTDKFVCNTCIGYVLNRRVRAERRRKKKMQSLLGERGKDGRINVYYGSEKGFTTGDEEEEDEEDDFGNETDGNVTDVENVTEVDRSIQDLMIQGKKINDLIDLADYAKLRLKKIMFLSRENDRRRAMFEGCL